ncbi:MAG: methyltransferase domain-containing protein [Myxococcota bacterium]|nr:methyltransferase domain-containing protein [Myxococcota bacterium]
MSDGPAHITDPRIEEYVLDLAQLGGNPGVTPELLETLKVMEETARRLNHPITGPYVGRTLYVLASLGSARRIFDAGCGLGYSAAWIAAATGDKAEILTVANSAEHQMRSREFHRRANLGSSFDYQVGEPTDILAEQTASFDLIYSDINKAAYPKMAQLAVSRLRPGGLYISDSCLWYGKVCSSTTTRDAWTASIDQHNQWIFAQESLFSTILDQREGLLVAIKRQA